MRAAIAALNNPFGMPGFIVIAIFRLSWVAAVAIHRGNR
jgi:hypothetical protein